MLINSKEPFDYLKAKNYSINFTFSANVICPKDFILIPSLLTDRGIVYLTTKSKAKKGKSDHGSLGLKTTEPEVGLRPLLYYITLN